MESSVESSKVLLACLGLNIKRKFVQNISMKNLIHLFNKQNDLKKILVFSRKDIIKAFIEFRSVQGAQAAKENYHEKTVNGFGKIRLFFSPLKEVDETQTAIEYMDMTKNREENSTLCLSEYYSQSSIRKESQKETGWEKDSLRENQDTLNLSGKNSNKRYFNYLSIHRSGPVNGKRVNRNSKNSKLGYGQGVDDSSKIPSYDKSSSKQRNSDYNVVYPSRVILVSDISFLFKDAKTLLNLFGVIGQIRKILFIRRSRKAFIEYLDVSSATDCITNLGELDIGGERLKICYSKQKSINYKADVSSIFKDYLEVKEDFSRNHVKWPRISRSVSKNLLIVVTKNEKLTFRDIFNVIQSCCPMDTLNLLKRDRPSHHSGKWFLVAGFFNTSEAVYAMIKCNFIRVKEATLNLYFY